ncbi:MAG: CPBP family intramembrane glutamic endopeptidase [Planctomycetota bacterium]|nr:CPBP family intramembrane glutamic endopeptidase [Planctomycetota bacterium]
MSDLESGRSALAERVGGVARESAAQAAVTLRRVYLACEFAVLFFAGPMLVYFRVIPIRYAMVTMIGVAVLALIALLADRRFDRRQLWSPGHLWPRLRGMLVIFGIGAAGLTAYTLLFERDLLLRLPLERTGLWLVIMCLYPLLSVYPQEILYRTFMFHRYEEVFRGRWLMIGASAAAFGFMHIVFENALAVILTTIGGLIFARTYDKTRSTFVVSVEHALFGDFIFTIGLGWYFFTGAVGAGAPG